MRAHNQPNNTINNFIYQTSVAYIVTLRNTGNTYPHIKNNIRLQHASDKQYRQKKPSYYICLPYEQQKWQKIS